MLFPASSPPRRRVSIAAAVRGCRDALTEKVDRGGVRAREGAQEVLYHASESQQQNWKRCEEGKKVGQAALLAPPKS
jgi:hypothetical protein